MLGLLFSYGLASIPMAYVVSLASPRPASAFSLLVIINLVLGVMSSIVSFVLRRVVPTIMSQQVYDWLSWFIQFFPIYSMSSGIAKVYSTGSFAATCARIPSSALDVMCQVGSASSSKLFGCCVGELFVVIFNCFVCCFLMFYFVCFVLVSRLLRKGQQMLQVPKSDNLQFNWHSNRSLLSTAKFRVLHSFIVWLRDTRIAKAMAAR